jgi:hypothetical protein
MKKPTPIRPLPESLVNAMKEADEMGIKNAVRAGISCAVSDMVKDDPEFRDFMLMEILKRNQWEFDFIQKSLFNRLSEHRSKGQLVQFRR